MSIEASWNLGASIRARKSEWKPKSSVRAFDAIFVYAPSSVE
jgi:hypothetical protein